MHGLNTIIKINHENIREHNLAQILVEHPHVQREEALDELAKFDAAIQHGDVEEVEFIYGTNPELEIEFNRVCKESGIEWAAFIDLNPDRQRDTN